MSREEVNARVHSYTEHVFVNNVRHWSMFAIILLHSFLATTGSTQRLPLALAVFVQAAKFGTIGFFLISGFLLGERIQMHGRLGYLKRRARRIVVPWAVWVILYCCLILAGHALVYHVDITVAFIRSTVISVPFNTAYWFVPNLLIALAILLACARYIDQWRFGIAALAAALFYSVNIYRNWIPSLHPAALVGFVFYLWLGAWSSRHWNTITGILSRCQTAILWVITTAAWFFSLCEAHILSELHYADPFNTLRITNQVFSVAAVLLLMKLQKPTSPSFINVREHTFGLYLIHTTVLTVVGWTVMRYAGSTASSGAHLLGLAVLIFGCTYLISLFITRHLAEQRILRWLVGANVSYVTKERQQANIFKHDAATAIGTSCIVGVDSFKSLSE